MTVNKRNRESGQALIMVTLSMVAMFGLLGLVVDVGWMHFRVEAAQTAADAAALAAAEAAMASSGGTLTCGSNNVQCQSITACPNPIPSSPVKDTDIACAYAKSNGFAIAAGGRQNVTVAAGTGAVPTAPGVTAAYWVTVRVAETVPQLFSVVLGNKTGTVGARATVAVTGSVSNSCVYALDPSMKAAFSVSGTTEVHSSCGIFVNSSNADAMAITGGAVVASTVKVVGNYTNTGGSTISPLPTTGSAAIADPFASVNVPPYSGCDFTGKSVNSNVTLTPGVYCNGLNITGGTVTFQPGTYILNGGGLSIGGGANVSGSGVTFFNTSNGYAYKSFSVAGGSTTTLSAPTSGVNQGLLFVQDRNIVSTANNSLSGGASMLLTGSLYFPTTSLTFAGGDSTVLTAILAKSVVFTGNSYIAYDPTGIHTGLGQRTASLIE